MTGKFIVIFTLNVFILCFMAILCRYLFLHICFKNLRLGFQQIRFMYQCLINKCGFSYCQSWTFDIQNTRSVGLKKMLCTFLCKSPHWELKRKETKTEQQQAGTKPLPCISEERREILLPAALPGTDVAQQTPPCHAQYHRFLGNSYSPTHCHVIL